MSTKTKTAIRCAREGITIEAEQEQTNRPIAIGVGALSALVVASIPAGAAQKTLVRLPEHTLVIVHLLNELNSSTVKKDDYVDFVVDNDIVDNDIVDNDIVENGYILIHGGTRGTAQVTEAHERMAAATPVE